MAELAKWPELEVQANPLDPGAALIAPVEIRFQVKPEPGDKWDAELSAECSVAGQSAPTPGAVLSFREWENEREPTLYCYALARDLREGAQVSLRVRPRVEKGGEKQGALWEREFRVRADGGKYRLE